MIPKPEPTKVTRMTPAQAAALSAGEHPADMRERLRAALSRLPQAARGVYDRENLRTPGLQFIEVVETVLYAFDGDNRRKVAAALGMDYREMCLLLVGYVLGCEE